MRLNKDFDWQDPSLEEWKSSNTFELEQSDIFETVSEYNLQLDWPDWIEQAGPEYFLYLSLLDDIKKE